MPSRPGPRSNPSFFAPNPDPLAAANDEGAFEYVGPDSFPDPPRTTFEDEYDSAEDRHRSRRPRNSRPRHRSRRASSQPPPAYSSRLSSPTMSRRTESPPPRRSKSHRHTAAYDDSEDDVKPGKDDKWANMKTYGRKGLSKLGRVASTCAAAQMASSGGRGKSTDRERSRSKDTYDDRRSHRRSRRYSPSPSPSPSPPRRRGTARHSRRDRPPINGRKKSYSVSPTPLSRDSYDHDRGRGGRGGGGRSHRRRARSPSYSDSSRSSSVDSRYTCRRGGHRRGRSEGDYDGRKRRGGRSSTAGTSRRREKSTAPMGYRDHMRAPKPEIADRWQMAARAALEAGGVTAFRLRKQPGTWGEKLPKIATAAMGAAAIDAFIDRNPRRQKSGGGGGIKGMAESVIGGMIASKVMGFKSATTHKGTPRYI
ncbi:hypothetical protein PG994_014006 [Apiospora phragmitis]|uniref:Uncharacterized protein n=1 Tax=Apiospora phragmitis TaxID=2905665 RepID=A0ABR1T538_9PEZI